jgi:hypothetical protein
VSASQADAKTMPMQTRRQFHDYEGECPTPVYMAAYEVYCHVYGSQQAMVEGGCRGGFSLGEIAAFLYARSFPKAEWSRRVDEAFNGMKV